MDRGSQASLILLQLDYLDILPRKQSWLEKRAKQQELHPRPRK